MLDRPVGQFLRTVCAYFQEHPVVAGSIPESDLLFELSFHLLQRVFELIVGGSHLFPLAGAKEKAGSAGQRNSGKEQGVKFD